MGQKTQNIYNSWMQACSAIQWIVILLVFEWCLELSTPTCKEDIQTTACGVWSSERMWFFADLRMFYHIKTSTHGLRWIWTWGSQLGDWVLILFNIFMICMLWTPSFTKMIRAVFERQYVCMTSFVNTESHYNISTNPLNQEWETR